MTIAAAVAGAAIAWLAMTLLAVSEGRHGTAAALLAAGIGLGIAAVAVGDLLAGAVLAAGGACAAALHHRSAPPGWGLAPPGSTPRLVGGVILLIAGALAAGSSLGTASGWARLAALLVIGLGAMRLLSVAVRWSSLAAGSALALGLGAVGAVPSAAAGAVVAVALGAFAAARVTELVA